METVLANAVGRVREATLHGRKYYVAPAALIVPGVLNGSQGRLYYSLAELGKNPLAWNRMPLLHEHPYNEKGEPVSGRQTDVLERSWVGDVFNTSTEGKLSAEAWFEEDATRRIDATLPERERILPRLLAGEAIELSTGLFTDNEPAKGEHNGVAYDYIAKNYRPDHVAVLPSRKGACSIEDGCGINVNVVNEYCATGPGGGIDPSCSSGDGGGSSSGGGVSGAIGEAVKGFAEGVAGELDKYVHSKAIKANIADLPDVGRGIFARLTLGTGPLAIKAIGAGIKYAPKAFNLVKQIAHTVSGGLTANESDNEKIDRLFAELEELLTDPEEKALFLKGLEAADAAEKEGITDNERAMLSSFWTWLVRNSNNPRLLVASVNNAFCPTGPGGGVDPSCGAGGSSSGGASNTVDMAEVRTAVSQVPKERREVSRIAFKASKEARTADEHEAAAKLHDEASFDHSGWSEGSSSTRAVKAHDEAIAAHDNAASTHRAVAARLRGTTTNEDNNMDRKATIFRLTANCKCLSEKTLNALSDEELKALEEKQAEDKRNAVIANAARRGFTVGDRSFVFNAEGAPMEAKGEAAKDCSKLEGDAKTACQEEVTENLSAKDRAALNYANKIIEKERQTLIGKLTSGVKDPERKKLAVNALNGKSVEELEGLMLLRDEPEQEIEEPTTNYAGRGGLRVTANTSDILREPCEDDYAEASK